MPAKKAVKKASGKPGAMPGSIDELFGMNAGKVWMALHENAGGLSAEKVLSRTGLSAANAWAGLGWLAREGKLRIENGKFVLNE